MDENRISYHESVRIVYNRIKKDNRDNIWDRYEAQGMGGDPDKVDVIKKWQKSAKRQNSKFPE